MAPRSSLKFPENTNTVSTSSKHLHPSFYIETCNEIEKLNSIAKMAWKGNKKFSLLKGSEPKDDEL